MARGKCAKKRRPEGRRCDIETRRPYFLGSAAGAIGEQPEEERCAQFLRQLDPAWSPDWTGYPT